MCNRIETQKTPILFENATFSWLENETPVLKEYYSCHCHVYFLTHLGALLNLIIFFRPVFPRSLNFRIKKGELFAIVGPVGSGKSSLLASMLVLVQKRSGRVNILVCFFTTTVDYCSDIGVGVHLCSIRIMYNKYGIRY